VPRLEHFKHTGVYYAASQAEALLCRDDPVAIIGGGTSAGQAAVFLSRYAARVTLIVRERDLGEYMSRYLADQIGRIANVRVLLGTKVAELFGDQSLDGVAVREQTGARSVVRARALFVFIGAAPCTSWLAELVDLDDHGFARTGPDASSAPGDAATREAWCSRSVLETSQPGMFAVGDVRSGSVKRVAAAVGEGAMAISLVLERM
jgi:thioredoxin reductase (NADPH)